MIVVATKEEYDYLVAKYKCDKKQILVTGVGGINVIKALSSLPRNTPIVNLGFVGSPDIKVGTIVKIGDCKLYHPNVSYKEDAFCLNGDVRCFTSCDFVLTTKENNCVFDMELAFILAMGFTLVKSYKVVSDNLSLEKYEDYVNH